MSDSQWRKGYVLSTHAQRDMEGTIVVESFLFKLRMNVSRMYHEFIKCIMDVTY